MAPRECNTAVVRPPVALASMACASSSPACCRNTASLRTIAAPSRALGKAAMIKGRFGARHCLFSVLVALPLISSAAPAAHNVILFVPDGLRAAIIDPQTAPTLARLRDEGVNFINSHSLFPTFTTANASAFASGHYLGDTGDFSNFIFTNFAVKSAGGTVTPFLET